MAEWRVARGWSDAELRKQLELARRAPLNFSINRENRTGAGEWNRYYTETLIALESAGPPVPGGPFERAWKAVELYEFSDPGIVVGHFDPSHSLIGRPMMLEIKVLGLHYLCGVRVGAVRNRTNEEKTVVGFRYDTVAGHIEEGLEWFLLTKKHATGEVWFRIHASWREGEFPNWWSRLGFRILGRRYQLAWHRLAHLRLREIVGARGVHFKPIPKGRQLVHVGPTLVGSDLWVLNQPTATGRALTMSKSSILGLKEEEDHEDIYENSE